MLLPSANQPCLFSSHILAVCEYSFQWKQSIKLKNWGYIYGNIEWLGLESHQVPTPCFLKIPSSYCFNFLKYTYISPRKDISLFPLTTFSQEYKKNIYSNFPLKGRQLFQRVTGNSSHFVLPKLLTRRVEGKFVNSFPVYFDTQKNTLIFLGSYTSILSVIRRNIQNSNCTKPAFFCYGAYCISAVQLCTCADWKYFRNTSTNCQSLVYFSVASFHGFHHFFREQKHLFIQSSTQPKQYVSIGIG